MKHPAFAAEKEYRLVGLNAGNHAREGTYSLIPYEPVPLNIIGDPPAASESARVPLRHIRVGPCPEPRRAVSAVLWYTMQVGQRCDVFESALPYRDW